MKKLIGIIFFMAVVFLFQHNALAAGPLRVGILDLQRCINESNEGKRIYQALKKKHESMQKRLDEKQKELIEMQKEIEKQSLMLSLDAKEDKQKEYERQRRDLGYLLQDLNEEMNKAETNARKKVLKDLEGIVKTISEKEKYDLILELRTGGVMFFSDPLDITDVVIQEYNKVKP